MTALVSGTAVGLGAGPVAAAAGAPTGLRTAGQACAAEAPGPYLSPVRLNDAQAVVLTGAVAEAAEGAQADFQVWDVTKPDERQQWLDGAHVGDQGAYIQLENESKQLDGVTYAWRVRLLEGSEASPWSDTCYFTVDRTGGSAPTAGSAVYLDGDDYRRGGIGVPGTFVVTPTTEDVVSYRYRFYANEASQDAVWEDVKADRLGGPVTLTWAPKTAGGHDLTVYAIDRAGNASEPFSESFDVRDTRPVVFSADYPEYDANLSFNVGVAGEFQFQSLLEDTESFEWSIDNGGPSGITAADDAGKATVMIAPTRAGQQTLSVRSVTREGAKYPPRSYAFLVDDGPEITAATGGRVVGSPLRIQVAPRVPNVESYVFWAEDSSIVPRPVQKTTVSARADGTAELEWIPQAADANVNGLRIQSRTADGTLSVPRWHYLSWVDNAMPAVTRSGGTMPGEVATFTARTTMPGVVDYVVSMNGDKGTEQIVKPAADGSATFRFTPVKRGYHYVQVVARNQYAQSAAGGPGWTVIDQPRIASADFPVSGTGNGRLAPGTFTFAPRLPGTVRYEYKIDQAAQWAPLAARADGTAVTPAWTPTLTGRHSVIVRGYDATGYVSTTASYVFSVEPATVTVTAVAPASVAAGAVRTLTVTGSQLRVKDVVEVTPAGGKPIIATVRSVSADGKTSTVDVNLAGAALGKATLTVRPYGAGQQPVVRAAAFTIAAPPAMRATKAPTVTGTVAVGSTVRLTTGSWTPAPTGWAYQWMANGAAIKGATGSAYVIPAALLGKRLTVAVTAGRPGYTSARAVSAATVPVAKGRAPAPTVRLPKITGTAKVGRTLTADPGAWNIKPDSYRYEWRVNGKLYQNGSVRTFKLTAGMRYKKVTVTVVARKAGYNDGRSTTKPVTVRP
ncbi:hypothetical protein Ade02nite_39980 [Paractinoplanes deccanensis]|uniref:Ig-like domain-containing protein n=1 Tax=Paractinoplanes deccanensis TaxID=113561 RepID=A0ABQ3Y5T6_9ACTN|nr:hypothetical protein [Actinoplanes deccanensis]GID75357.1 hypothetical protein Ade02nite_39980 [Actinoplanes deccanensis]